MSTCCRKARRTVAASLPKVARWNGGMLGDAVLELAHA